MRLRTNLTELLMYELKDKQVLVIGLGTGGQAACELLRKRGANVLAIDSADTRDLRGTIGKLRPLGVEVKLGVKLPPEGRFNLAVVSPAETWNQPLVRQLAGRDVPVIGELELGFQQSKCLSIAVAGTNGKTTTSGMIERLLAQDHRKTVLAGVADQPLCAVVDQSKELDFLILRASVLQLEATRYFRPAVAVLMNLAPDHLDVYGNYDNYLRANARLFQNQQPFDWVIVQSEALEKLRALKIEVPSKIITFSATNRDADLSLDRGLLISRLPNWSGPLLDMDHCRIRGPHHAENLMAALAVGHVLRTPLEAMLGALKNFTAPPHCCERLATINGVTFINDAKSANVDALHKALLAAPAAEANRPNVWLVAGGCDKGLDFHDVGPVLSQRAKGVFLFDAAAGKMRAAWSLFTPCSMAGSLLEAVSQAANRAVDGDVVLLSPASSRFDLFRDYQELGEVFCQAVQQWGAATRSGGADEQGKGGFKVRENEPKETED